jgi:uncharacterized protein YcfL
MKKIWVLFILLFILSSCFNTEDNIQINKNEKIVTDSDIINISDIDKQPNF